MNSSLNFNKDGVRQVTGVTSYFINKIPKKAVLGKKKCGKGDRPGAFLKYGLIFNFTKRREMPKNLISN